MVNGGSDGGRRSPSPSPLPENINVDAMSYEELLALSEAIGDVKSKGMSESEIERLPTAVWERKRAEGEPEEEPAAVEEPVESMMEAAAASGTKGAADKAKAKKKGGFFARMRGSNKPQPPLSSPPLSATPSLAVAPLVPTPADDGKGEKAVVGGGGGGGLEQWRDTCSICLERFRTGELIKFLPCFHHFHAEELDNWLLVNASCPVCKQKPIVH